LLLVNPRVGPEDEEVRRWACGAGDHLEIEIFTTLTEAAAGYRALIGTASGRGRDHQPVISPSEAARALALRGPEHSALLFGNETSGLSREDLDRCDLVVRVPTTPEFPVLNLTQTIAIVLAYLSMEIEPVPASPVEPACHDSMEGLMGHLGDALLAIGFLDADNPDRILRQIRRLLGRAGASEHEVAILRGMCRQILWAARVGPLAEQ
jgi:TrmH family RNA methyltransferase